MSDDDGVSYMLLEVSQSESRRSAADSPGSHSTGKHSHRRLAVCARCPCACFLCCGSKRRLAVCTTVTLAVVLTTLLVVRYVVLQNMVQSVVNNANMGFEDIRMLDPDPDTRSVRMQGTGYLSNTGPYSATMHSTTLTLYTYCAPEAEGCESKALGTIGSPAIEINPHHDTTEFTVDSTLHITDMDAWTDFGVDLVQERMATWHVGADLSITTHLGIPLEFSGISLSQTISVPGMNALPNVTLDVFQAQQASNSNALDVVLSVTVENPSIVSLSPLGILTLDMIYKGTYLGTLHTDKEVVMLPGLNHLHLTGPLNPATPESITEVFSNYLCGHPVSIQSQGAAKHASTDPLYSSVVSSMSLVTELRPVAHPLGIQSTMNPFSILGIINAIRAGAVEVPTKLKVHNPFLVDTIFHSVALNVVFRNTTVATIDTSVDSHGNPLKDHFIIPGNSSAFGPYVQVKLNAHGSHQVLEVIEMLLNQLRHGYVLLGLEGRMTISEGNLMVETQYCQSEAQGYPNCIESLEHVCDSWVAEHGAWPA